MRSAEKGMIAPGDQADIEFVLEKPVGIEKGVRFAMREGGKTVGAGMVTEDLTALFCVPDILIGYLVKEDYCIPYRLLNRQGMQ